MSQTRLALSRLALSSFMSSSSVQSFLRLQYKGPNRQDHRADPSKTHQAGPWRTPLSHQGNRAAGGPERSDRRSRAQQARRRAPAHRRARQAGDPRIAWAERTGRTHRAQVRRGCRHAGAGPLFRGGACGARRRDADAAARGLPRPLSFQRGRAPARSRGAHRPDRRRAERTASSSKRPTSPRSPQRSTASLRAAFRSSRSSPTSPTAAAPPMSAWTTARPARRPPISSASGLGARRRRFSRP